LDRLDRIHNLQLQRLLHGALRKIECIAKVLGTGNGRVGALRIFKCHHELLRVSKLKRLANKHQQLIVQRSGRLITAQFIFPYPHIHAIGDFDLHLGARN